MRSPFPASCTPRIPCLISNLSFYVACLPRASRGPGARRAFLPVARIVSIFFKNNSIHSAAFPFVRFS